LPDWLKTAITLERMMGNMKELKGEEPIGTDAEAYCGNQERSVEIPQGVNTTHPYIAKPNNPPAAKHHPPWPNPVNQDTCNWPQNTRLKSLKDKGYGGGGGTPAKGFPDGVKENSKTIIECATDKKIQHG